MRGLGILPEDTTFNPSAWIPANPQPGTSGWALLVTLLGTAITTYGQYLLAKQYMASTGYTLNPLTSGQYSAYTPLHPYEPEPKGTPQWVWIAGGLAAVYLLTQRKTA